MSAGDKGGALVRSPPGIVETYKNHVTSTNWDHQASPQLQRYQQTPPHTNASVTKISSGDVAIARIGHNKQKDRRTAKTLEDSEPACNCGWWARARQLSHDIHELRHTHSIVLSGLHHQLDDLKLKNRDLTFKLLMGPFASEIRMNVNSPESDVTSPKRENKSTSTTDNESELQNEDIENIKAKKTEFEGETFIQTPEMNSGVGDPRTVRSLNVEILEEEVATLQKKLQDEISKNKYLDNIVQDLKRQIKQAEGAWRPPTNRKINQQKKGVVPPLNPEAIPIPLQGEGSTSNVRLPSIASKSEASQSENPPPHHKPQLPYRNKRENQRKHESRSAERRQRTPLPAIVPTSEEVKKNPTTEVPQYLPSSTDEGSSSRPYPPSHKGKGNYSRPHRQEGTSENRSSPSRNSDARFLRKNSPKNLLGRGSPGREKSRTPPTCSPTSRRRLETNLGSSSSLVNGEASSSAHSVENWGKSLRNRSTRSQRNAVSNYTTSDGAMASSSSSVGSLTSAANRPRNKGKGHKRNSKGKHKKDNGQNQGQPIE